jgi:hypothetical protein
LTILGMSGIWLALGAASAGCADDTVDTSDPTLGAAASALTGPSGLVHRWTFDEPSGSAALDSVGGTTGALGSSTARVPSFDGSGAISLLANAWCDQQSFVDFGAAVGQLGTADFTVSQWLNTS